MSDSPMPETIFAWREEMGDVYTGEWCPYPDEVNVPPASVTYIRGDGTTITQLRAELAAANERADAMVAAALRRAVRGVDDLPHWIGDDDNGTTLVALQDALSVIRALAPAPVVMDWKPIETAPRDGTWFRARTEYGTERVVRFGDEYDNYPISDDGAVWSTAPVEWTPVVVDWQARAEAAEAAGYRRGWVDGFAAGQGGGFVDMDADPEEGPELAVPNRNQQFIDGAHWGIRKCIGWLHARAGEMNDPKARDILNATATNIGMWKGWHLRNRKARAILAAAKEPRHE
jgi:hypothetical protein